MEGKGFGFLNSRRSGRIRPLFSAHQGEPASKTLGERQEVAF